MAQATGADRPTLSPAQRLRVRARVVLTRLLGIVPEQAARAVRSWTARHPGTLAGAVLRVFRHRSISRVGDFEVTGGDGLRLVGVDSQIVRRLYWLGATGYEAGETRRWQSACAAATRIVEIGANVGYYTVAGSRAAPGTPYVSVEANPEAADIVRRNVRLNDLVDVEVIQAAAVGEDAGPEIALALPDQERYAAPTGAFLAQATEGVGERRASSRSVSVPTRSARSLLEGADLVKLDIEGAEHLVLEAAGDLLVAQRAVLFVEVLQDTPVLRSQLADLVIGGWEARVLTETAMPAIGADEIRTVSLLQRYGSRDLVLGPPDRLRAIG